MLEHERVHRVSKLQVNPHEQEIRFALCLSRLLKVPLSGSFAVSNRLINDDMRTAKTFRFDLVCPESCSQDEFYNSVEAENIVRKVIDVSDSCNA